MKSESRKICLLCLMLFLQYMLVSVWWVPYAAYLAESGVSASLRALALSSMAVGFFASSVMGAFADRYFSAQKVLATSNFIVATLLAIAGLANNPKLTVVLVFIVMLLYMPTWALTGSIVLKNVSQELFPRVRLFGTLGWVASGLFSLIFINVFKFSAFDGTPVAFLCGSGVALTAAVIDLFLPDTPPVAGNGRLSLVNILGFKAFALFKDRNYLVFFLCTFTSVLGYAMYYTYAGMFFHDRHFEYITVTLNWGQVGELVMLFLTTAILARLGFRRAMLVGLGAMVLRYTAFWWGSLNDNHTLYIIGVLFHGVIFGLFFVAGQIYTDRKSPPELRAQSQGLIAFLVWGVALLTGNWLCNKLISINTAILPDGMSAYNWSAVFGVVALFSALVWVVFCVFYRDENKKSLKNK